MSGVSLRIVSMTAKVLSRDSSVLSLSSSDPLRSMLTLPITGRSPDSCASRASVSVASRCRVANALKRKVPPSHMRWMKRWYQIRA